MINSFNLSSNDNSLFVTSQCNNCCIMCCQPPSRVNDIEILYKQNVHLIRTAPEGLQVIGITGGEPTLMGNRLFDLIGEIRSRFPHAEIHILSNGRAFCDSNFVHSLKKSAGDNLVVGIPLHSDYGPDHDIIAGSKNAFVQTVLGLYNLASEGINIELRIAINLLNYKRLLNMADFIFKNLSFVSWTAFMGMELIGNAVKNKTAIWVEPLDYISNLRTAVLSMDGWNMETLIFNLPLCLLPKDIWKFACRSISDWKTSYLPICNECSKRMECCGLFSTSREPFIGLKPI